jgi:CO dehydrogenase/acetyl-CoA synthase alpha subunit
MCARRLVGWSPKTKEELEKQLAFTEGFLVSVVTDILQERLPESIVPVGDVKLREA